MCIQLVYVSVHVRRLTLLLYYVDRRVNEVLELKVRLVLRSRRAQVQRKILRPIYGYEVGITARYWVPNSVPV